MGKALRDKAALVHRAELPPNPNGGYQEELIAKGSAGWGTRFFLPDKHPLTLARKSKRITEMQYQAGIIYREKTQLLSRKGKDSTLQLLVSGGGDPTNLTDAQCDATTWLVHVNFLMTREHRHIVNQVCGNGETPAKAVRMIGGDMKNVSFLFRQALDALGEAIIKKFQMARDNRLTFSENAR